MACRTRIKGEKEFLNSAKLDVWVSAVCGLKTPVLNVLFKELDAHALRAT